MKRFSLTFTGRLAGSTGPLSRQTLTVEAVTMEAALEELFLHTHEHVRLHSITELAPINYAGSECGAGDE